MAEVAVTTFKQCLECAQGLLQFYFQLDEEIGGEADIPYRKDQEGGGDGAVIADRSSPVLFPQVHKLTVCYSIVCSSVVSV